METNDVIFGGDLSSVSQFFHSVMDDDFLLISALTFFACEAVFTMLPIEKAKSKQAASLLIGGILGLLLTQASPVDAFIQGVLAGGATTILVAKFKKPSAIVAVEPAASVTVPEEPVAPTIVSPVLPTENPTEHL